jgi:hypothetical protein
MPKASGGGRDFKVQMWMRFEDVELVDAAAQAGFQDRAEFMRTAIMEATYRRLGRDRVAEVLGMVPPG